MANADSPPTFEAMSETKPPFGTLSARLEERILQPLRTSAFARRTWFSITVASIVALYAGLLGWMLWRDAADPPRGAQMQETPIEVVAEMPKPPTLPVPQPPTPKQEIEKPATSAPRAVNDVKEDSERADKDPHAPKSAAAPAEAEPKPTPDEPKEAAEPPAKDSPEKTEAAETPKPDKEAEALDKAPPEPPKKPAKLAQAKPAPPKPPHRPKSVAQQLAGNSELPDYTFAKPMRKRAKVSGGSEDDRYLAVVYGLITQNRHAISVPYGNWSVSVSFVVDGGGNLVGVQISKPSGYAEVDNQAVEAVEAAAPYPPPPSGGNTSMVARLRSLGSEAMAGDR